MTPGAAPAVLRLLCAGCGMLMAATAGAGPAATLSVPATIAAVAAGLLARPVATVAVLAAAVAVLACDPPPALAAVSGLAAVGYLLLRYAADGAAEITAATGLAAAGFAVIGAVAASFPVALPWLPLLAPPAVFGAYLVAVRPLLGEPGRTADPATPTRRR